jgi:hypothetical protein
MTMPTEIIELPTGTANAPVRINPMTTQRLAADAAANAPARPWQPAPLRPAPHPRVVELTAEAESVRAAADAQLAQADRMGIAAKITGQRISSLENERTELQQRLSVIERRDLKAGREQARRQIHELYGKVSLTAAETTSLNAAVISLSWYPLLEREVPIIVKDLKARLAGIETDLGKLTGDGK